MRRLLAAFLMTAAVSGAEAAAEPSPERGRPEQGRPERGRYVFDAGGCAGCHTPKADREAGILGAGGRALKTPFGTFYSPNVTPDPQTGIGRWTEADFRRALHDGRAPGGSAYFPAFPFTSYSAMTDADAADLWAYMKTLPAVARANRPHDVAPPFGWRLSARIWQWLFFTPGRFTPDPARTAAENRGAYLVGVLGHCGECHTPRDSLGVLDRTRPFAGTGADAHGEAVPNITPDAETGIGKWSDGDFKNLFAMGMLPDADFVGSGMAEAVDRTTSRWTPEDRAAATAYLRALTPIRNKLKTKKKTPSSGGDWN